jgi:hypothetical protein
VADPVSDTVRVNARATGSPEPNGFGLRGHGSAVAWVLKSESRT